MTTIDRQRFLAWSAPTMALAAALVLVPGPPTSVRATSTAVPALAQSAAGQAFQANLMLDFPDGVTADATVLVSDPFLPLDGSPGPLRMVSVGVVLRYGRVQLGSLHTLRALSLEATDSIGFGASPITPATAIKHAMQLVVDNGGVVSTAPALPPYLDVEYRVKIQPVAGKAWGSVAGGSDLVMDVSIAGA